MIQVWGSEVLSFRTNHRVIPNIRKSMVMRLELSWYGEGRPVWSFPLTGASKALDALARRCNAPEEEFPRPAA